MMTKNQKFRSELLENDVQSFRGAACAYPFFVRDQTTQDSRLARAGVCRLGNLVQATDEAAGDCSPFDLGPNFRLEGFVYLLVGAERQLAPTNFRELVLGQDEPIKSRPAHIGAVSETSLDVEGEGELGVSEPALDHVAQACAAGPIGDRDALTESEAGHLLNPPTKILVGEIVYEEADVHVNNVRSLQDEHSGDERPTKGHLNLRAQCILPLGHETLDDLEDFFHGRLLSAPAGAPNHQATYTDYPRYIA